MIILIDAEKVSQDDRVERPCAHLLSQAHQNYNYLQNKCRSERLKSTRKDLLQLKIERRSHKTVRKGGVSG